MRAPILWDRPRCRRRSRTRAAQVSGRVHVWISRWPEPTGESGAWPTTVRRRLCDRAALAWSGRDPIELGQMRAHIRVFDGVPRARGRSRTQSRPAALAVAHRPMLMTFDPHPMGGLSGITRRG